MLNHGRIGCDDGFLETSEVEPEGIAKFFCISRKNRHRITHDGGRIGKGAEAGDRREGSGQRQTSCSGGSGRDGANACVLPWPLDQGIKGIRTRSRRLVPSKVSDDARSRVSWWG